MESESLGDWHTKRNPGCKCAPKDFPAPRHRCWSDLHVPPGDWNFEECVDTLDSVADLEQAHYTVPLQILPAKKLEIKVSGTKLYGYSS